MEEIPDAAHEKAVEAVTDKAVEETHSADFDMVLHHGKKVINDPALSPKGKGFASQIFGDLLQAFSGMTQAIRSRLKQLFHEPDRKNEAKKPIRRSIRKALAGNQKKADAYNTARTAGPGHQRKTGIWNDEKRLFQSGLPIDDRRFFHFRKERR